MTFSADDLDESNARQIEKWQSNSALIQAGWDEGGLAQQLAERLRDADAAILALVKTHLPDALRHD